MKTLLISICYFDLTLTFVIFHSGSQTWVISVSFFNNSDTPLKVSPLTTIDPQSAAESSLELPKTCFPNVFAVAPKIFLLTWVQMLRSCNETLHFE